jgi:nickel superoxide dismutase
VINKVTAVIRNYFPAPEVEAHCDGPCGVYDPSSARIAAEASLSMTKKILALDPPSSTDQAAMASYHNTMSRYIQIKEEQTQIAKEELLILWTDYFKPNHLDQFPDFHDVFWQAAKLCSAVKVEVNQAKAEELMSTVKKIHEMFWATKNRDVEWYTAS